MLLRADGAAKPIRVRRSWRDDRTEARQGVGNILADDGIRYGETAELGWQQPLSVTSLRRELDTNGDPMTTIDLGWMRCIKAREGCWVGPIEALGNPGRWRGPAGRQAGRRVD